MEESIDIIKNVVESNCLSENITSVINALRYLRNLCASDPRTQNEMTKDSNVVENTKTILNNIIASQITSNEYVLCLGVGLQFLANLLVNNKTNQGLVWENCRDLFDSCLGFNNHKVKHVCLMILYNIFLGNPEIINNLSHSYESVFELSTNENLLEYSIYIIELFCQNPKYLDAFYSNLNEKSKLIILDELKRLVAEKNTIQSKSDIIKFFSCQFSQKADWILNVKKGEESTSSALEAIKILDILVMFSSDDEQHHSKVLQEETSLFINCVALLKAVHTLSKEVGNHFTMANKLSDVAQMNDVHIDNPVFGFKADLIRIIGNMCWKNKKNQDIIRDLEGIQVILDCCVIDAKNPFITQWSILAIRNVCEKNTENQKLIMSMSSEKIIDKKYLQEIGIMLNGNNENDSIYIAPLDTKDSLEK